MSAHGGYRNGQWPRWDVVVRSGHGVLVVGVPLFSESRGGLEGRIGG